MKAMEVGDLKPWACTSSIEKLTQRREEDGGVGVLGGGWGGGGGGGCVGCLGGVWGGGGGGCGGGWVGGGCWLCWDKGVVVVREEESVTSLETYLRKVGVKN